ncbi:MAG: DUF885 domain-containing protein [Alphaproteobacteria bacterium]|nr:MAG: DUF885 domain-containing protein [Alphaproteobacteria bacterium]
MTIVMIGLTACTEDKPPVKINDFFQQVFEESLMDSPESLTYTRFMEQQGKPWRHNKLDDLSLAHEEKNMARDHHNYDLLKGYDVNTLDGGERLSARLMNWQMENDFALEKYRFHGYSITQLDGLMNDYPLFMNGYHQINSVADAEDYIARLQGVKQQFDDVLSRLKIQQEKGIILPKSLLGKVIEANKAFTAQDVRDNILFKSFAKKVAGLKAIEDQVRTGLYDQAEQAISQTVYPAYDKAIAFLVEQEKIASEDAGVWKLPDGDNYYQAKIRASTTTNMTAAEIHDLGLSEVARIQGEIMTILGKEGYDLARGFEVLIQEMAEDDSFYYSDDDEGRAQILKDYATIIEEVNARVADVFNVVPEMGVEVRRVPEFSEKSAPGAYYSGPALDGSRPGIFWANLYDIKATPKYGMRTLAYHEAVPGHHFQIAIAQELKDLPMFRKFSFYTAYTEGWALYSERLAKELGLQEDSFDDIGRLQAELFRAVRLVVDTGLHYKRWTREEAIDYMARNTGYAMSDVVAEIERYMVWPAQALAYKVGMLKILELRETAKAALGENFDLRAFHDVMLTNGAMPLDILEEQVTDYIAKGKK